ncbi:hypothetical protein [Heyndrickxia acidiproducens]|uniref:hypothetical protein n=1 Tax=Heyndrickxia acidiproducens TaxID=1121084 RepID=UPI00035C3A30|nr:hypothetical protein [Heyndrickxia acidiproducens]
MADYRFGKENMQLSACSFIGFGYMKEYKISRRYRLRGTAGKVLKYQRFAKA